LHGFLGVLPMRTTAADGVPVRYVYPDSPAAKAQIAAGDVIVSLQGEPIDNRIELMQKLGVHEPTTEVELEVRRGEAVRKVKATLAQLPETIPQEELPSAGENAEVPEAKRPKVGSIRLKVPELPNDIWAYVPEAYNTRAAYGVVVWLHGPGGFDWQETLTQWKPLCDRYGLIFVAPKSADSNRWTSGEVTLIDRVMMQVVGKYNVDPTRIVVHGYESGGVLAFLSAYRNRELFRGVAAVEAAPNGAPPENDPLARLTIYMATAEKSRLAKPVESAVAALRQMGMPVTVKSLGDVSRYLSSDELAELARWIDTLDRI
jgi:serine protease Do